MNRVAVAIAKQRELEAKGEAARLIATGGFAPTFNVSSKPHHEWVEKEIRQRGAGDALCSGPKMASANTVEDAIMIRDFCRTNSVDQFLIVTSQFHLVRCRLIFNALFKPIEVSFLAAPNSISLPRAQGQHETAAIKQLRAQGGVIWDGRLYSLT